MYTHVFNGGYLSLADIVPNICELPRLQDLEVMFRRSASSFQPNEGSSMVVIFLQAFCTRLFFLLVEENLSERKVANSFSQAEIHLLIIDAKG